MVWVTRWWPQVGDHECSHELRFTRLCYSSPRFETTVALVVATLGSGVYEVCRMYLNASRLHSCCPSGRGPARPWMFPGLLAATAWTALSSAVGAGLAALALGCPTCAPTVHCPPAVCHCGGGGGFGWASLLTAFAAGVLAALGVLWRVQFWAAGGGDAALRFSVGPGQYDAASGAAPVGAPLRRALAPAPAPIARRPSAAPGVPAVPAPEAPVWRPRG